MKENEKERYTRLECDVVELQTEGTVLDGSPNKRATTEGIQFGGGY